MRLALSIPQALALLIARRPAAIFTTGGYVAIPVLLAAAILRIPSVLWDGNVIPGRSVRLVARLASVVTVSHPATGAALGVERTYVTGTPIRSLADVDRDEARERFGGRPGERILLVFGGSQAVRRINDAVWGALPRLAGRVRVIHVTGDAGYAEALTARAALPEEIRDRYRPFPFLHEDMTAASPRRTSPWAGPAPRRSPRPRPSRCQWRSCRTRTPRGTSASMRRRSSRPAQR